MFLHEADLQECPADTVLDVINGYFTDAALQSHLRILVSSYYRNYFTSIANSNSSTAAQQKNKKIHPHYHCVE